MKPNDLTAIDWKRYGVTGELPRLVAIVAKRRERAREAWQARDETKVAVARAEKDMAAAIEEAVANDEPEPDLTTFRRDREEAHSLAQARVSGTNTAVAAAERDVARFLVEDGDRVDVVEAVRTVLEEQRDRAVELAEELAETVHAAAEAAAILEAVRGADPSDGMPTLDRPKSYPAVQAVQGLAETVATIGPKPPRTGEATLAEVRGW